jgi:hypothetical protein
MPKKKPSNLKKIIRIATIAVIGSSAAVLGLTAFFIWKTFRDVALSSPPPAPEAVVVDTVRTEALDAALERFREKTAADAPPAAAKNPFLPATAPPPNPAPPVEAPSE